MCSCRHRQNPRSDEITIPYRAEARAGTGLLAPPLCRTDVRRGPVSPVPHGGTPVAAALIVPHNYLRGTPEGQGLLDRDPLDLVERDLAARAIVELCRARAFM